MPGLDTQVPRDPNIPAGTHWTDIAPPGSVVLMQQPPDQTVALLGDIVATRYLKRGIRGVVVDGSVRDVVACGEIARNAPAEQSFTIWSRALSSVGTSLEAKPWAVDIPLIVGGVEVRAGDVLVADEGEGVACVIPRDRFQEVLKLLPKLKEADDGLLGDVQGGMGFGEAVGRWPGHYTNHK